MTNRSSKAGLGLTVAALLLAAAPASAALLDRGPQDPTLVFPQWYRDLNGTALGLCLSQAASPNPGAAGKPMCFPLAADPNGFAGNLGPEIFYNNLNVLIGKGAASGGANNFALRYIAGLEASYLPLGVPVHGTETVFARIRIVINTQVTGRYTVTHPFGIEVFDVTDTGPRAVFFTADVPLAAPMNFDGALGGRIGPFIQWDVVDAGITLNVGGNQFLGDPNLSHTFTGSPFGTNYVEVTGPAGSNVDGAGGTTYREVLGSVSGQRWLAPIATKFSVDRAVYSTSTVTGLNTVDVWATAPATNPPQKLVLTGLDMPSLQLVEYVPGNFYGHIEYAAANLPTPSGVSVTNLSSVPVATVNTALVDVVDADVTYDPSLHQVTVNATTSDMTGPTLTLESSAFAAVPVASVAGAASRTVPLAPGAEPPRFVRVVSSAGGVGTGDVVVGSGSPMNQAGVAVAVADGSAAAPIAVAGTGSTAINVGANDTGAGNPFSGTILILTPPTLGTAVAGAGGIVSYTAKAGSQGTDSFNYAIQTAAGISNVAQVTVSVPFVAPPPVANADDFAMQQNTSRTYAILANDTPSTDLGTVTITSQPAHGTVRVNADGTITYTPAPNFNSALDTFAYTVASRAQPASVSAPATVTVDVFGGAESVSFAKINYTVAKSKWTITGSTNWFNAALTHTTASCYLTTNNGAPIAPQFIGTAPVDITGKFQLVPVGVTPTPTGVAAITCTTSNGGSKSGGVVYN